MIALSGLSGAGKSTAAKTLEDLGYFVVDNLPAELFPKFAELAEHGHNKRPLAFVIDAREAEHLSQFISDWLKSTQKNALWFLNASDQTLIKRFQETRRPHPLDHTGQGIIKSIEHERSLLADLKSIADQVIHTDNYNAHQLKAKIHHLLDTPPGASMTVRIVSFGFKHGIPPELDLCFDVRFLENPYFVESLKPQTGLEQPVKDFVLRAPNAKEFLEKTLGLIEFLLPCYETENKTYVTIAIGCTGGRHRSVALAPEIARMLESAGYAVQVTHRDLQK